MMLNFILAVDIFGTVLAIVGFLMAFRPKAFRRMARMPPPPPPQMVQTDARAYVLRIAGVMIMMFGITLAVMFTLVYGL